MNVAEHTHRLTATIDSIPSLPAVVSQVMTITGDPESSAEELLSVICADPAYTAQILKLANSAFYSRMREIATVKQAIMVIGFKEIRNLVVASAVFNNFQQIKRIQEFDALGFWRHSFEVGLAAQMLAGPLELQGGQLFVAGLIHDLGKLVLLISQPEKYSQIIQKAGQHGLENIAAEKDLLGLTHAEMGKRLFNRWMFQELYLNTTHYHHSPHLAINDKAATIVVHLADHLVHIAIDSDLIEASLTAETISAAQTLGIDWDTDGIKKLTGQFSTLMEARSGVMTALFS